MVKEKSQKSSCGGGLHTQWEEMTEFEHTVITLPELTHFRYNINVAASENTQSFFSLLCTLQIKTFKNAIKKTIMHFDNYAYKGKQQMNYFTSALFHSSNLNAFSVCRCFAIKRQMTQ